MAKSIHLPGLNGLRAIAALSVMWGHTFQRDFGDWGVEGFKLPVVADGVTLFFVISGFLITYLLLHEQEQSQTVSIPKFYMRRILRIWPIYYLYLLIAVFSTSTWHDPNIWYYCFFTANIPFILTVGIWPIVHYWSLGVEEQFYLFWPWLVKLTKGRHSRLLVIAASVCVASRFDCMMIGAIGAILYFMKSKLFTKFLMNRALGVVCFLLLLFSLPWANVIPAPIRPQLIAILSLVCIASQLENPIINLENRVCDFVGKISYGIYVIHPLLIFGLSALYRNAGIQLPEAAATILIYVIITAATAFVAWLSYKFFESPFLRLKNRFAIVQSQNSMMK